MQILLDDEHCIAVDKPAGLAVIPGRGETTSALEMLAAETGLPCAGAVDPRLRVVHRIDKETSGVVLFAKHIASQRQLSHQFQNNRIRKEYLALVAGSPAEDSGTIDTPIAPHPADPRRMTTARRGRPALTAWQVEGRFGPITLLRVFPRTGKTHQIRVHLKSIGLPLVVDPLYNRLPPGTPSGLLLSSFKRGYKPSGDQPQRPLIDRLTLHAESLGFLGLEGREITVKAPLPKDFRSAINMLQKYARR
jgi:23S rRNA pseudouridine1911/1915/1917 synthase